MTKAAAMYGHKLVAAKEREACANQLNELITTTPPAAQPAQPAKKKLSEPLLDTIAVNLMREGLDKHRARELAEHFIKLILEKGL